MKKLLLIIVTGFSLISCTKNISKPSSAGAADQNIFYHDSNIYVENMVAEPTATGTVTINFTTAFENNISRIELMSSTDANTFCTTQFVDVNGNSTSKRNYSFSDSRVQGSTMYYMLRFKNNNGNWSYSPYVTVKVY